jgi:hypothetical protein
MRHVKHFLINLWVLVVGIVPRKKPRKRGYGYPGPEDNPFDPEKEWYHHMKWDQDHGWADYS